MSMAVMGHHSGMSDQLTTIIEQPKQKKRKRNSRSVQQPPQQQDPFASCAAELQIEFFKKVKKFSL